jgi:hypothetical protein
MNIPNPGTVKPTEVINGKNIPIGTLGEFYQAIYGASLADGRLPGNPGEPTLGIEKFKTAAAKFYRLIWVGLGVAWLATEDIVPYRTKAVAVINGELLAGRTGAKFNE